MRPKLRRAVTVGALLCLVLASASAQARNPIRRTFFDVYPAAEGTQLDDLPSNAGHCGVCHFDFDGGGPRNPYGLSIEVGLNNGLSNLDAILAVEGNDADSDGFVNSVEASEVALFSNTPTFPGLSIANYSNTLNVDHAELEPYLTPSGSSDTTPPVVAVTSPNGGESIDANSYYPISFTAALLR